jgi:hypothetical protein
VTDRSRRQPLGRLWAVFQRAVHRAGRLTLGGAGATLSYATGPNAGQVITDPAAQRQWPDRRAQLARAPAEDLGSLVNDLRASKIYRVGQGDLTLTGGFYASRQAIHTALRWAEAVSEVRGDGQAHCST